MDGIDYTSLLPVSSPRSPSGAAPWELDAASIYMFLEKYAAVLNKVDALRDLVDANEGMEVKPHIVSVFESRSLLEAANARVARGDLRGALEKVNAALSLCARAEVDPTLVGLLYFPAEHQMAVLLPLWSPLVLPIVGGFFREIKRYREKARGGVGVVEGAGEAKEKNE
jgi:phosphatidylinositol glycan class S